MIGRLARPLLIAAGLTVASGCLVGVKTPYYRPEAPDGRLARAGEPRTRSVILFEREGVFIGVKTAWHGEELRASISFEIPEGRTVELLDPHIEVSLPGSDPRECVLSGRIWIKAGRTQPFPVDAPMIGKDRAWRLGTATGYAKTKHAAFFFGASLLDDSRPSAFAIRVPRFAVNGEPVELPIIQLSLAGERLWTSLP